MKLLKLVFVTVILFTVTNTYSQVSIGNTNPQATLDIEASDAASPANNDGVLIPRMSNFPPTPGATRDGMLIFYTGASASGKGFYYWNQTTTNWIKIGSGDKNTLDEAYDQGGAGAGSTINATDGVVTINGEDGFLVTGTLGSGDDVLISGSGTRLFFNPKKAAFRAGHVENNEWGNLNIGNYSTAMGSSTIASGDYSSAFGYYSQATGTYATALGFSANAISDNAVAIGTGVEASGDYSTAFGYFTDATGDSSTAMGRNTVASGHNATAMGENTIASLNNSTAMGYQTQASGTASTAMGHTTIASNYSATAMGHITEASGNSSMASGWNTTASGGFSTSMGKSTLASGNNSTAMGDNTLASGESSTSMGFDTTASGGYSTAMGTNTEALSYAETSIGYYNNNPSPNSTSAANNADQVFSIGNGSNNTNRSNALTIYKNGLMNINDEYNMPLTDGSANQIMTTDGSGTMDFVDASTLFTDTNTTYDGTDFALSNQSLPAGQFLTGISAAGTLIGAVPNDSDNQNIQGSGLSGTDLTIGIENGTSEVIDLSSLQDGTGTDDQTIDTFSFNTSTNELTLEIEDDGIAAQTVDLSSLNNGNTLDEAYDQGSAGAGRIIDATDGAVRINGEDGFLVTGTHGSGNAVDTEITGAGTRMFFNPNSSSFRAGYINGTQWDDTNIGSYSIAMGESTEASATNSIALGYRTTASGSQSTAMGRITVASGNQSTAMGHNSIATGENSTAMGRETEASAFSSIAIGNETLASGHSSTAMGYNTEASAFCSTAMGRSTNATGESSTAMGYITSATGENSTAMGILTNAIGENSTVMGYNSIATGDNSTAMGDFTQAHGDNSTAMGVRTSARSYAETTIGYHNNTYTPLSDSTAVSTDRLFNIGNGTSHLITSNALTIYKSGLMNINDAYNMPLTDGTANQIMATDGADNVSFVDASTVFTNTDDQNISGSGLSGTNLTIGIENGTSEVVDLSSLDTGGDITGVTAGTGLTGGGTTGTVTLNVVANNGLTTNADNVQLGGTLIQDTNINYGTFDTRFNLDGTGDFIIQDNGTGIFEINDAGTTTVGRDMVWRDTNINGTVIAQILDDGDDGRFVLRENGNINVDLNANTEYVFNQQGDDRDFRVESNGNTNMLLVNAGSNEVGVGGNPDTDLHVYHEDTAASAGFKIQNQGANNNWWRIFASNATGNLFIYSTSGGATPRGNFNNASGVYSATSDRRLKKDFKPLPFSWQNFMQLETLSYLYKTQKNSKRSLGLIAQDVENIYPELVTYNKESDVYHLNYSGFGVVAIKAIQELKDEVDTLKKENATLKTKLNQLEALEARLTALENNTNH